ncbi:G:T/U mismatch-specific uracil/thymine DNA-glycosylase [Algibacter lectus]|uniref:G:T/U mismatch-specific uracil/thymine DNA-glycosylase n=1 Tax=Algibacter lectus TaxID=221126 RepID=A0A090WZD8_9FLAO|nr:G:T/U mismatch-specific uracil/thymine DNA-glycosylase [Algibacter lectus]
MKLELISNEVPRIHEFEMPSDHIKGVGKRVVKTVSLTSSSGSANRAIGSMALYKQLKQSDSNFNTFDFRVMQYREFF